MVKTFSSILLTMLQQLKILENHIKNCQKINQTNSVLFPKEGRYIIFPNFKRLIKATFIIYANCEYVLMYSSDHSDYGTNTKNYQDYIVCSYG